MRPAISVENLSKQYRIGVRGQDHYHTLRESLASAFTGPWNRLRGQRKSAKASNEYWALKDVSFDVHPGEVIGIIGRNGAGKSTLLKVLSRITEPTSGRAVVRGRMSSLLEVGTGFHPELTGRENIYLNGAILGMKHGEINRKFDEIVAFSEIEKFLDTPVKRYSSGMYVRLAFAVAAHLEPDILIIDEVLAVGDAGFQRKCLSKVQEAHELGRTVIFVSHQLNVITRICSKCILLHEGTLIDYGAVNSVIPKYLHDHRAGQFHFAEWPDELRKPGNEHVKLTKVVVSDTTGCSRSVYHYDDSVVLEVTFDVHTDGLVLVPNYHLYTSDGVCVFVSHEVDAQWLDKKRSKGRYLSTLIIPKQLLAEGMYQVNVAISTYDPLVVHVHEKDAVRFVIRDSEVNESRGAFAGQIPGVVRPILSTQSRRLVS